MEEVRISDWPEPPGSHAWLPAYGFQHDLLDKDDFFGSNGEACSQTSPPSPVPGPKGHFLSGGRALRRHVL
ncbi:hypothetical protein RR48_11690 [Papilio machaon]|uniref:Uncharacterized protein n=1 Tax=Papilio machaon TaxID=76193 RepID=A0A194QM78_PAPMA|nr:hypothetical protein RR48_11690 [Papilio machaon]